MSLPLPVAADLAGLERFALALFAEAARDRQETRLRAAAVDAERVETFGARRAIPLAYRLWLAHLLWLEEVLHTLDCRPGEVTALELAGLQAVARARARFLSTRY